jgi:hypothetical protein
MKTPGSVRKRCYVGTVSALFVTVLVLSVLPAGVLASSPPQQPLISVSVGKETVSPGSGIDVSVFWMQNAQPDPVPPGSIEISLFALPGGSPAGVYTIPQTGGDNDGATRRFEGTIPGAVLPAGRYALVATDPVSGETARTEVSILESGEAYQAYRNRQIIEAIFYPVAMVLIVGLALLIAAMVANRHKKNLRWCPV